MSRFYGQVCGNAQTSGSRRGTSSSGIRSSVQSYDGSIAMYLRDTKHGMLLRVEHHEGSSLYGNTIFDGTIEQFVRMCLCNGLIEEDRDEQLQERWWINE